MQYIPPLDPRGYNARPDQQGYNHSRHFNRGSRLAAIYQGLRDRKKCFLAIKVLSLQSDLQFTDNSALPPVLLLPLGLVPVEMQFFCSTTQFFYSEQEARRELGQVELIMNWRSACNPQLDGRRPLAKNNPLSQCLHHPGRR